MTRCSFVPTDACGLRETLTLGASKEAVRQALSYYSQAALSPGPGSREVALAEWITSGAFEARTQRDSVQCGVVGEMTRHVEEQGDSGSALLPSGTRCTRRFCTESRAALEPVEGLKGPSDLRGQGQPPGWGEPLI